MAGDCYFCQSPLTLYNDVIAQVFLTRYPLLNEIGRYLGMHNSTVNSGREPIEERMAVKV
jgi:hypothetical protein